MATSGLRVTLAYRADHGSKSEITKSGLADTPTIAAVTVCTTGPAIICSAALPRKVAGASTRFRVMVE